MCVTIYLFFVNYSKINRTTLSHYTVDEFECHFHFWTGMKSTMRQVELCVNGEIEDVLYLQVLIVFYSLNKRKVLFFSSTRKMLKHRIHFPGIITVTCFKSLLHLFYAGFEKNKTANGNISDFHVSNRTPFIEHVSSYRSPAGTCCCKWTNPKKKQRNFMQE